MNKIEKAKRMRAERHKAKAEEKKYRNPFWAKIVMPRIMEQAYAEDFRRSQVKMMDDHAAAHLADIMQ